jgi:hypothetical protein
MYPQRRQFPDSVDLLKTESPESGVVAALSNVALNMNVVPMLEIQVTHGNNFFH